MKRKAFRLVRLQVSSENIEEMYQFYDSGMADHTTANAVSLALKRIVRCGITPKIVSDSRNNASRLEVGDENFPLPREVFWWLGRTMRGHRMAPATFSLILPVEMLHADETSSEEAENAIAA